MVRLMYKDTKVLASIPKKILADYDVFIKRGLPSHKELDDMLDRLEVHTEMSSAVEEVDSWIESVPEDINPKKAPISKMHKSEGGLQRKLESKASSVFSTGG